MASTRETELRHYFAIRSDLATAVGAGAQEDIDFHLGELAAIRAHTDSDRLRRACRKAMSAHETPITANLA